MAQHRQKESSVLTSLGCANGKKHPHGGRKGRKDVLMEVLEEYLSNNNVGDVDESAIVEVMCDPGSAAKVNEKETVGSQKVVVGRILMAERPNGESSTAQPPADGSSTVVSMMRTLEIAPRLGIPVVKPAANQNDCEGTHPKSQLTKLPEEVEDEKSGAKYNADLVDFMGGRVLDSRNGVSQMRVVLPPSSKPPPTIGDALLAPPPVMVPRYESVRMKSVAAAEGGAAQALRATAEAAHGVPQPTAISSAEETPQLLAGSGFSESAFASSGVRPTFAPSECAQSASRTNHPPIGGHFFGAQQGNPAAAQHYASVDRGLPLGSRNGRLAGLPYPLPYGRPTSAPPMHCGLQQPIDLRMFSVPPPNLSSEILNMTRPQMPAYPPPQAFIPMQYPCHASYCSGCYYRDAMGLPLSCAAPAAAACELGPPSMYGCAAAEHGHKHPHYCCHCHHVYLDVQGVLRCFTCEQRAAVCHHPTAATAVVGGAAVGPAASGSCANAAVPHTIPQPTSAFAGGTPAAANEGAVCGGELIDGGNCMGEALGGDDRIGGKAASSDVLTAPSSSSILSAKDTTLLEDIWPRGPSRRANYKKGRVTGGNSPMGGGSRLGQKHRRATTVSRGKGRRKKKADEGTPKLPAQAGTRLSESTAACVVRFCFRCGGIGHKMSACATPRAEGQTTCYACGAKGHTARYCNQRTREAKKFPQGAI